MEEAVSEQAESQPDEQEGGDIMKELKESICAIQKEMGDASSDDEEEEKEPRE
jgi:hypothetical protein